MLLSALAGVPGWRIVLAPALGGLAVGLYFRFFFPERRPLGPADAIEAALLRDGAMPAGKSLLGTLANALSLGVGASVGREGPVVLLGYRLVPLPALALASAVGALVALAMMASIFAAENLFARVPVATWLKTALAGLAVGVIAFWVPQVLSYGQEATHNAMLGRYGLTTLLVIVMAKLAATSISLGGGFGGGVFSPALVLGSALGGACGHALALIFPGALAAPGAYAVIGAAAVAAPVLGAPISTALIVLEMTEAWTLAPGVALAALIATAICRPIVGRSFFTCQLARRGVVLPRV